LANNQNIDLIALVAPNSKVYWVCRSFVIQVILCRYVSV